MEGDRAAILEALERTGHNVTAAARALGTTRQTLRYRIEKHGIHMPKPSDPERGSRPA